MVHWGRDQETVIEIQAQDIIFNLNNNQERRQKDASARSALQIQCCNPFHSVPVLCGSPVLQITYSTQWQIT